MSCGKTVYLKAKVPKVLVARKQNTTSMQLEAISHQPEEGKDTHKVSVHKWSARNEKVQLAFIFSHKTNILQPASSKRYLLRVEGDKLKLDPITTGKKKDEPKAKYLFKWHDIGAGSWRRLQSVFHSSKQLFIDLEGSKVSLSSNSAEVFQLTSNGTTDIQDTDIEHCSCWKDYLKEV